MLWISALTAFSEFEQSLNASSMLQFQACLTILSYTITARLTHTGILFLTVSLEQVLMALRNFEQLSKA